MDKYKKLAEEFHSVIEECISEFKDRNPRSLNKLKAFLITDSSCVNERDPYGKTALYRVLDVPDICPPEIVKLLLNYGANANYFESWGSSLELAVTFQHFNTVQLLLLAGIKVGTINGDSTIFAALAMVKYKYERNLDVVKLLVKHYFLENSDFEAPRRFGKLYLHLNDEQSEELQSCVNECSLQVKVIKSKKISTDSSLFYFVKRRLSYRISISRNSPPMSSKEFNQLVSIMVDNDLSQYLEIIANLVGMPTMTTKLHELQVHAIRNSSDMNCRIEKIYLNWDCLHHVIPFLSAPDLLRLFIAYAPVKYVGLKYGSKDKFRSKRSPDNSVRDSKRRRKIN